MKKDEISENKDLSLHFILFIFKYTVASSLSSFKVGSNISLLLILFVLQACK